MEQEDSNGGALAPEPLPGSVREALDALEQSKHLETATFQFANAKLDIDCCNLRHESYADAGNTRIPSEMHFGTCSKPQPLEMRPISMLSDPLVGRNRSVA